MHEILDHLPAEAVVLDLGSATGSFDIHAYPFRTVRLDLRPAAGGEGRLVVADAARLPFRGRTFDAVICNHGLEHFQDLKPALQEIGRVLKRDGALFVAVPDATTFQDRLYRWLTEGGEHVNLFASAERLAETVAWYSGLPHRATKLLHTSYAYLNARNLRPSPPARLRRFCRRWELPLFLMNRAFATARRHLGARLTVYGWAMYFGSPGEPVDTNPWLNVCLRCGQGHPPDWLAHTRALGRSALLGAWFKCPSCGAKNPYSA